MENACKTAPLKELNELETHQISSNDDDNKIIKSSNCISSTGSSLGLGLGLGTPNRLKVPKPFKYLERYTSPTDHMMSPISKGLLARSRRGGALLPPSKIHSKIHELRLQEAEKIQLKMD